MKTIDHKHMSNAKPRSEKQAIDDEESNIQQKDQTRSTQGNRSSKFETDIFFFFFFSFLISKRNWSKPKTLLSGKSERYSDRRQ